MNTFTLLNDSVLVEPLQVMETTDGLAIPENTKERPVIGIVVADSEEDNSSLRSRLEPGTKVLFSRFAGAIVEKDVLSKLTGKDYERDLLLLNASDIRMVFPPEAVGDSRG